MRRSTIVPALALLPLLLACRKEPLPAVDAAAQDATTNEDGMPASREPEEPPDPPLEPATRKGCEPACAGAETCVGTTCVPANVGLTMTREHTCVLDASGRVQCWGANKNGELGDGTRAVRIRPVDVIRLTDAVEIVARDGSTCARRRGGDVVCWGRLLDKNGEVLVPTAVDALRGAIDIAFGRDFLCGAMPDGGVRCLPEKSSPLRSGAGPVSDAIGIAANGNELCALHRDHTVTCWTKDRYAPDGGMQDDHARMEGATDIVALRSSGEAICAIAATGRAKCWSDAGIARTEGTIRDIMVGGMHDFARLGAVVDLSFIGWPFDEDCAIKGTGETVCWSPPYLSKRRLTRPRPPLVLDPKTIDAPSAILIASTKHPRAHCILTRAGEVHCWGEAAGARVGSVRPPDQASPRAIDGVKGVRDVTASDSMACARLSSGAISCWGAGKTPHVVKAEAVDRLLSGHCASIKGALTCFDRPFENALPDAGLRDIVELAPAQGGSHILSYWARSAAGLVSRVSWSRSNDREGKWTRTFVGPTDIKNARALFAAGDLTCARETNAPATELRCWNRMADVGDMKTKTVRVPADLEQLQLRGNSFNSSVDGCGVSGGRVGCFDSKLEIKWLKLDGVRRFAKSPRGVSCALTNAGALYCWGNDDDLTGHGTAGVTEPRVVPGLESGVAGFAFPQESFNHDDAVFVWMNDGRLLAWGHNGTDDERMGQLGWVAPSVIKSPQKVER